MSAFLVAASGHTAPLGARAVRVGSAAEADLPILGELGLAPMHYEIMPNEHGYWIRGLTPGFPLLINGQPMEVALLQEGDVITAGVLDLTFRHGPPQAPPAAPPDVMPVPVMQTSAIGPETPSPVEPEPVSGYRLPELAPGGDLPEPSSGYRMSLRSEEQGDERHAQMSESERRTALLMEQTEERTRRRLEELKEEQNFSGAFMAALVTLAVAVFAYSAITGLGLKIFMVAVAALGYAIGWIVKVVGKGQEIRFGKLGAGTALAAILIVNFLAVGGLVEMQEETSEPADTTEAVDSAYSSGVEEDDHQYDPTAGMSDGGAVDYLEQVRLARNQTLQAAAKAGKIARFEPEEANEDIEHEGGTDSTTTVIQTVGFMWIMFGPKSLLAYFIMTVAAYRASFRSLTSAEASALHGRRA